MSWLSFLGTRYESVEQAEASVFRAFYAGLLVVAVGVIMTLTMVFGALGIIIMAIGGLIVMGDIVWLVLTARRTYVPMDCPACHSSNQVFPNDRYFSCVFCGYRSVLRES